jgi:phosphatidylglycerol:prolipoprotein diacylglycerol transferase
VIGARVYYVIFRWDEYKDNLINIFNIRQGGLAIYGAVIAAIITVFIYSKIKKISFGVLCDTAGLGLILGQAIGRWGNFFNREAFGEYTDNLFAMRLPIEDVRADEVTQLMREHALTIDSKVFIQVHPTFLYESLWNLGVLGILMTITLKRKRRFEGEIFLLYLLFYGIGRFWIEGLRTDQLLIPGTEIAVSQVLSALLATAAAILIALLRRHR